MSPVSAESVPGAAKAPFTLEINFKILFKIKILNFFFQK